jgi:hypothetical protein
LVNSRRSIRAWRCDNDRIVSFFSNLALKSNLVKSSFCIGRSFFSFSIVRSSFSFVSLSVLLGFRAGSFGCDWILDVGGFVVSGDAFNDGRGYFFLVILRDCACPNNEQRHE